MTETIRKCTISDTDALLKLSYDTFYEAFASQNTPANMKAYADSAFTQGKIRGELQNPESHFYFIYDDDQLAGYLKVNIGSAQSEDMGSDSLEVERIYILEAFHKKGFGKALLNLAYDIARAEQKKKVWLGVWEKMKMHSASIESRASKRPAPILSSWVLINKLIILQKKAWNHNIGG